jgi:hypothetical protein
VTYDSFLFIEANPIIPKAKPNVEIPDDKKLRKK